MRHSDAYRFSDFGRFSKLDIYRCLEKTDKKINMTLTQNSALPEQKSLQIHIEQLGSFSGS
jgi:hypothetical protein